jgi:hypothetical protein
MIRAANPLFACLLKLMRGPIGLTNLIGQNCFKEVALNLGEDIKQSDI